jgi:menaquinone-dependent protoporphyrinogen oxidase
MIRVLIPYGTSEGQTARIAEYLADVIRDPGYEAYPVELRPGLRPGEPRHA